MHDGSDFSLFDLFVFKHMILSDEYVVELFDKFDIAGSCGTPAARTPNENLIEVRDLKVSWCCEVRNSGS